MNYKNTVYFSVNYEVYSFSNKLSYTFISTYYKLYNFYTIYKIVQLDFIKCQHLFYKMAWFYIQILVWLYKKNHEYSLILQIIKNTV